RNKGSLELQQLGKVMLKSCAGAPRLGHAQMWLKRDTTSFSCPSTPQTWPKRGLGMGYVWEEFLVMFLGQFHGCEALRSKRDNQTLPRPTSSHVWPKEINWPNVSLPNLQT
ncbi:hypothetical protein PIB30_107674, partial [Stylosanthes scabra]|nr:hypothetical protein [Stylosanthes scabra]